MDRYELIDLTSRYPFTNDLFKHLGASTEVVLCATDTLPELTMHFHPCTGDSKIDLFDLLYYRGRVTGQRDDIYYLLDSFGPVMFSSLVITNRNRLHNPFITTVSGIDDRNKLLVMPYLVSRYRSDHDSGTKVLSIVKELYKADIALAMNFVFDFIQAIGGIGNDDQLRATLNGRAGIVNGVIINERTFFELVVTKGDDALIRELGNNPTIIYDALTVALSGSLDLFDRVFGVLTANVSCDHLLMAAVFNVSSLINLKMQYSNFMPVVPLDILRRTIMEIMRRCNTTPEEFFARHEHYLNFTRNYGMVFPSEV